MHACSLRLLYSCQVSNDSQASKLVKGSYSHSTYIMIKTLVPVDMQDKLLCSNTNWNQHHLPGIRQCHLRINNYRIQ